MNKSVVVVAVSVDPRHVVLYSEDGSSVTLEQGDPRITGIMDTVKGPLGEIPPCPVEVSLEMPKPVLDAPEFGEAEKASGGLVRFFKVAKAKIANWFNDEPETATAVEPEPSAYVSPQTLGVVPGNKPDIPERDPSMDGMATPRGPEPNATIEVDKPALTAKVKTNEEKLAEANARLDMLESEGIKPSNPKFKEELKDDETVVAVTNGGRTIIPEAQHLGTQLKEATKLKDFTGFHKFLERLGTVVNKRRFSVEDLMKFMKHGDLPIADDGSIVIYKRLSQSGTDSKGNAIYVDVHSGRVKQRVGSRVFMDESLVDPDRRQDCSNGLHVAALSYLSGFSGNITIIGKVAPEDVIAVPEYSNNKMRVSGYDILAVLTPEQANKVNGGGKLSDVAGGTELLNAILRGKHIQIDQLVQIGGARGTNLKITDLDVEQVSTDLTEGDIRNKNLDLPDNNGILKPVASAPVAPSDLKPTPAEPKAKAEAKPGKPEGEAVKKETKAEIAQRLWAEYQAAPSSSRLEALVAFKKLTKKSWSALGISDAAVGLIVSEEAKLPKASTKSKTVSDFSDLKAKTEKAAAKPGTYKARMAAILGTSLNETNAREALALKKEAKKGWAVLGVSDEVVAAIEALTK